ncbi:hypothetical protein I312_101629 [Cryptococcus bacillisporus CA1280]|uniref:Cupin 2 conserved barrel domain-containing protein n=1 Tax=Cryptococcus bacillisporus CA1280 TaxID=1296109 RepID=A0A0D0VJR1_CRYGA|nr:hypothetical protein I312_04245 [Cryptococcus bacillisporus CA1280]
MAANSTIPIPTFRRIVTSHHSSDKSGDNVTFHDDTVSLNPVLNGGAFLTPLYSAMGLPAANPHVVTSQHISDAVAAVPGIFIPGGTNGSVTVLTPNFRVGMHRSSSIDYNVFLEGSAYLVVPDGKGGERRTLIKAGELVIQTGTLHAWEAGPDGAKWVTVVVAALPVEAEGKILKDVDF